MDAKKKGQALIEFIPVMMVFMVLISACLTYFRALKHATIRQEVVRNLAFSQINNSGSLTKVDLVRSPASLSSIQALEFSAQQDVGAGSRCFRVVAGDPRLPFDFSKVIGLGSKLSSKVYPNVPAVSVIHRQPGGGSCL